ncbi:MAG TPA: type II secretion system protein M [Steroidobacteraceae bacterium]|nr:type II secretion system protein M [Steroidobacteraceae bacterium]
MKAPGLPKLTLPKSLEALSPENFARLEPRERRLVAIGAVALAGILLFGVIVPLDHAVARERGKLNQKRADLAWMQSVSPELAAAAPPPAASGESLLVIIDRSARESGLASSMAGSEPRGENALSIRLEKAPFDTLVGWLARLSQQNGVTVDSADIERTGEPGVVNASIVLHSG